jgi:hypothetical protein
MRRGSGRLDPADRRSQVSARTLGPAQHEGAVAHAAGQDVIADQVPGIVGSHRADHPPARGLEAEHAAQGRRNADRAAAVAAVGDRDHARGYRSRSPAGRAAGRGRGVPGVAGGRLAQGLGDGRQAEFRRRRLAQRQAAHLAQGVDKGIVGPGRRRVRIGPRTPPRRQTRLVGQILDQGRDRHRPGGQGAGPVQRTFDVRRDQKAQTCRRLCPTHGLFDDLDGRRFPRADAARRLDGIRRRGAPGHSGPGRTSQSQCRQARRPALQKGASAHVRVGRHRTLLRQARPIPGTASASRTTQVV